MAKVPIKVTVNGEEHSADVEPRLLLVHFLRETLRLTGTHIGCDTSHCGACTVVMDGRAIKSCTAFAVQADGRSITTVEGLEQDGKLHPLAGRLLSGAWSAMRLLHSGNVDDRNTPFLEQITIPVMMRSATRFPATCVAAPATSTSSRHINTLLRRCAREVHRDGAKDIARNRWHGPLRQTKGRSALPSRSW